MPFHTYKVFVSLAKANCPAVLPDPGNDPKEVYADTPDPLPVYPADPALPVYPVPPDAVVSSHNILVFAGAVFDSKIPVLPT